MQSNHDGGFPRFFDGCRDSGPEVPGRLAEGEGSGSKPHLGKILKEGVAFGAVLEVGFHLFPLRGKEGSVQEFGERVGFRMSHDRTLN
jgi:hypothetical protein